jgi:hypothetical protein
VYFIRENYNSLIIFQQFKPIVEKKSGYVLNTLHAYIEGGNLIIINLLIIEKIITYIGN